MRFNALISLIENDFIDGLERYEKMQDLVYVCGKSVLQHILQSNTRIIISRSAWKTINDFINDPHESTNKIGEALINTGIYTKPNDIVYMSLSYIKANFDVKIVDEDYLRVQIKRK